MTTLYRRRHRDCDRPPPPVTVPPARDTVESLPDLDDGEAADSGTFVIDPDKAATLRAEWAASARDTLPCAEAIIDTETSPALWGAYPGSLP